MNSNGTNGSGLPYMTILGSESLKTEHINLKHMKG